MSYDRLEEKQLLCEDYIGHDYSQVIDMKAIHKLYRRKFSEIIPQLLLICDLATLSASGVNSKLLMYALQSWLLCVAKITSAIVCFA